MVETGVFIQLKTFCVGFGSGGLMRLECVQEGKISLTLGHLITIG